jgi:serine/threonine protein kinase
MGCCHSASQPPIAGPQGIYSPGSLSDKYNVTSRVLGQGTFGVVKVCRRKEPEGALATECAVKAVQLYRDVGFGSRVVLAELGSLETEISVMRSMGTHPNILELFDAYRTPSQVQIVLEYARGGTLLDRLATDLSFSELKARAGCTPGSDRAPRTGTPPRVPGPNLTLAAVRCSPVGQAASAIRQLAEALAHLHAHSICHRDVKLNNVMLADERTFVLKLLDFGSAHAGTTEPDGRIVMRQPVGTVVYM